MLDLEYFWYYKSIYAGFVYRVQVNSCYEGMNGERQWWISCILYISAANCEWKHPENSF